MSLSPEEVNGLNMRIALQPVKIPTIVEIKIFGGTFINKRA